jgi:DNA primase large subunit
LGGLGNVLDMSGPARTLSDEEREKVKTLLRERLPRVADRLEQLATQEPKMAQLLIDRVGARVQRAESVRKEDPEVADLRLKEIEIGSDAISLVRDWRKAKRASDAPAAEKAGAELRTAISNLFDVRVKLRESELRQVTQRLQQMQGDLNRLQSERERVVERTFKQMTERGGPGQPGGQGRRGNRGDGKSPEGRPPRADGENAPPRDEPRP